MVQAEQVTSDQCLNEENLVRGNGHIKEPSLARAAIREAYIAAYRRGWLPGDPESAQGAGLSSLLSEVYQRINGRLLDKLADDSELAKIRDGVIQDIHSGAVRRSQPFR